MIILLSRISWINGHSVMSKMSNAQIQEITVILVACPDFITLYGNYNTILYTGGDSMIWDFMGRPPQPASDRVVSIKDGP